MKLFLFTLCLSFSLCFGQTTPYLWLVEGKNAGADIEYRPNDYIQNERNKDRLIIAVAENSTIIAPVSGKITSFAYCYFSSLTYSVMFGLTPSEYVKDMLQFRQQQQGENWDTKFITATMAIETADRATVWICGIKPVQAFRTGSTIKAGDIIGKSGYCMSIIPKPAIAVSISKNSLPADPMTPFGLKSTFTKPQIKQVSSLSQEAALQDITILTEALAEGYPGLYDYSTPQTWSRFLDSLKKELPVQMTVSKFRSITEKILYAQKDNHLCLIQRGNEMPKPHYPDTVSPLFLGFINDSLTVLRTGVSLQQYYGKTVTKVNGLSPEVIKKMMLQKTYNIDGLIQSTVDMQLASINWLYLNLWKQPYIINFGDGSEAEISPVVRTGESKSCEKWATDWSNFFWGINEIQCKNINDTIAFIRIPSFMLNDVEIDKISQFVKEIKTSCKHLIIDIKNNNGGDEHVAAKLFSLIAQKPFYIDLYEQVNKQGDYSFFKYTTNCAEGMMLFDDYKPQPNKKGFYLFENEAIYPNTDINFKGKIYLLTDERSLSAATLFAGWVHKEQRGVIVGRETGSAYHQMNATKFANLLLPNSQLEIAIPLIKSVFDTNYTDIPFGRGILPNYIIQHSLSELESRNGDTMLNYTLNLIYKGVYWQTQNGTKVSTIQTTKKSLYLIYSIIGLGILAGFILLFYRKKRTDEKQ